MINSMGNPDAQRWDKRYRSERETWLERGPRALLGRFIEQLPRTGLALDAACGVAASGLLLARRGLRVIALDISEYALRLARQRARAEGLSLQAAVVDLSRARFPEENFDIILNFRFLERETFPAYRRTLKPGGWLFFETYANLGGNPSPREYYLEPGELKTAFEDFEIIYWEERELPESENHPARGLASLVARKSFR
jgi:SAM-dependent methyltransferase